MDKIGPEVIIKPATRDELDILNEKLKSYLPNFHEKKIEWQEKGEATWLIAWIGDEPVGHLLIKWNGAPDEYIQNHVYEHYPYLQNLAVKISHQRKGIGTQLVNTAEKMIKNNGHKRVGMAVSTENDSAKQLYGKLGYKEWEKGPYTTSWKFKDQKGKEVEESEVCTYLVKELSSV